MIGTKINFNKGEFIVTYFDGNEIRIKRTTEPKIEVAGDYKDNKIKLMGWSSFLPYKIVK